MQKLLALFALFFITTACIKTAEQVQREKRFENMSEQMKDSQGLVADMTAQMKDLQHQLDKMNGRIEELEHRQKKLNPEDVTKMNESLVLLKSQQEASGAQLTQIQNELKEQRGFIEKVTSSLGSLEHKPAKAQKKSAKEELASGVALIKRHQYNEGKEHLEALIDHPELSPGDHNKVFHSLGKAEYHSKNYEKSLVYFSKIYTKFPKASLAPSSLLYIARCLKKLGKKDEAKEAYAKVLEDYPGTTEASEAKKEI